MIVRDAGPQDAEAIAALIRQLGFETQDLSGRIEQFAQAGEPVLVADAGGVIGCATWHVTPALHRPAPVGRITMLVVDEDHRGKGAGKALTATIETRCRDRGCGLIEVTSNRSLEQAHAFYRGLGYAETSRRFAKTFT